MNKNQNANVNNPTTTSSEPENKSSLKLNQIRFRHQDAGLLYEEFETIFEDDLTTYYA